MLALATYDMARTSSSKLRWLNLVPIKTGWGINTDNDPRVMNTFVFGLIRVVPKLCDSALCWDTYTYITTEKCFDSIHTLSTIRRKAKFRLQRPSLWLFRITSACYLIFEFGIYCAASSRATVLHLGLPASLWLFVTICTPPFPHSCSSNTIYSRQWTMEIITHIASRHLEICRQIRLTFCLGMTERKISWPRLSVLAMKESVLYASSRSNVSIAVPLHCQELSPLQS